MAPLARRVFALVAVLALLVAGVVPASSRRPCPVCPRDCPMHTAGTGDHHGAHPRCHHAAGLLGIRAACGHGEESAPSIVSPLRSVLPARVVLRPSLAAEPIIAVTQVAIAAVPLEPPTDPPRAVPT